MKLTISRESLITPLQSIAGVVEKKQTMPVLSNVLLEAEDNTLTLTGTNMEVELVARVAPVHVDQPGRITVPARKLADICRALGDEAPIDLAPCRRCRRSTFPMSKMSRKASAWHCHRKSSVACWMPLRSPWPSRMCVIT